MFRFWYVVPRLLLLLTLCLFLQFGLAPLLRQVLQQAGQSVVGAKVEVGACEAFPLYLSTTIQDVQVSDPKDPMRNLFTFEEARLQLDSRAMVDRRLVVNHGTISGLRFDVERATSGELEFSAQEDQETDEGSGYFSSVSRLASDEAARWWETLQDRLEGDLQRELQSILLAQKLAASWEGEYDVLRSDVQRWKGIIRRFRDVREELQHDPWRGLQQLPGYLEELARLRDEIQQATANFERLRQQLRVDQLAVESAKEHDLQHLRELTQLEGLDSQSVTDYLLGEELSRRLKQWSGWLGRARTALNYVVKPPKWNRQGTRGTDVLLAATDQPSVLVRSLLLAGQGRVAGGDFSFIGKAADMTYQPRRHDRPAVFEFSFQGAVDGQVRAVIDHRGQLATQRFTVNCPRLVHQEYALGRDDQWALRVARGAASCWIDLEFSGDQLTGDLRWREDQLRLQTTATGSKSAMVARGIQSALDEVDRLHAHATLTGSAARPHLQVRSNLGSDLSSGLQLAAEREMSALRVKLAERLEREVNDRMSRLSENLSAEQSELLAVLKSNDELLAGLQQLSSRLEMPSELLGVQLPLTKFLGRPEEAAR